jgi:hypothetical protein
MAGELHEWRIRYDSKSTEPLVALIMLDATHELRVTRLVGGVAFDVWDNSRADLNGPVFSQHFDNDELMPQFDEDSVSSK